MLHACSLHAQVEAKRDGTSRAPQQAQGRDPHGCAAAARAAVGAARRRTCSHGWAWAGPACGKLSGGPLIALDEDGNPSTVTGEGRSQADTPPVTEGWGGTMHRVWTRSGPAGSASCPPSPLQGCVLAPAHPLALSLAAAARCCPARPLWAPSTRLPQCSALCLLEDAHRAMLRL